MKEPRVIQGLNLLSTFSTVVLDSKDTEEVRNLLDLISNFHPIFINTYYFHEDTLYIETEIPFLWRNAAECIYKLSNNEMKYEEAKEYMLYLIKQRVASMSTIPTIHSAYQQGYEVTPMIVDKGIIDTDNKAYSKSYNRHHTLGCGKGSEVIYSISSSSDCKIGQTIQKDKWSSNMMIERLQLPIPKWQTIDTKEELEKAWDSYTKPVVIKPTGLIGGKGVVVGIETLEEAKKAFEFASSASERHVGKEWQRKVMIQEQVPGDDYRLLVVDGKLEIATKRIPAFIVGDGQSTIHELIEETNKDPRRDVTSPVHTLKPINIDEPLLDYLKEQNLTLESIPAENEKINVRKVASMSQGGITEDFTDLVAPEIKYVVESIASSIHAFVLGVDILCNDISKPLTKDNGGILEINMMPEAYLNFYPVLGTDRSYVVDTFVKKLLKHNKTKKVVVVGTMLEDIPTLLRKSTILKPYIEKDEVVGEYKEGEIRINGLNINKDLEKWRAVEALKVNASLDVIMLHNRDWEEVRETGLGFNNIDLLIVSKEIADDEEMKVVKKYKSKGYIKKIRVV